MSVLKSIKGTLQNVQHDLSESWKNLTSSSSGSKKSVKTGTKHGVNLDAGADLLNKFQDHWMDIHIDTEANALKAQSVDTSVSALYLHCEHQNHAMNQILSGVSDLPQLVEQMQGLVDKIVELKTQFGEVESVLTHLEDLCEKQDLRSNKLHHQYQLAMYKQKRDLELETTKVHCARQHANKVQGYEEKLQAKLRERQEVFQGVFTEDMENYKLYGQTPRKTTESTSSSVELADINLDDDRSALDEFLLSEDTTSPHSPEISGKTVETPDETGPEPDEREDVDTAADEMPSVTVTKDEELEQDMKEVQAEPPSATMATSADSEGDAGNEELDASVGAAGATDSAADIGAIDSLPAKDSSESKTESSTEGNNNEPS